MNKKVRRILLLLLALLSAVSIANAMLYRGSNVIASWSAQGIGSVTISETAQVKKGYEYTMSLTWSVAGQWQRTVIVKKTCTG